jgi:DNA repair exonuclease SbcCD ATPase subunit
VADAITTYVREILDNVQVIEATRAAATEEKVLAGVRAASGAAGVKAYKELQKAQSDSAKAAERRTNKIEDELNGNITKTEALTRAILGQTDAIKAGGGATESAGRGAQALSAGSNKAAESAEKLAGVMGLVSPEAATLTRELGNVAKGMSVAGSAQTALSGVLGAGSALLGPLAAVAAAAAFAYSQYAENAEKAAEAEKKWRQEQKDSADLGEKLTGQITALQREQAVLAGTMTQVEVDTKTAAEAIDKDYAESIVKAINKVDDFKAQLAALDTKIKNGDGYAYELLDQQNALNESLEQAQIEYDGLNARLNTLQETSAKVVAGKAAEKQATKDAQEAEKKAAEAKRRAAEATRKADKEAADAARELEKARTDELAIAASLTKAEEDRTKAISKGVKALRAQEDAAKKTSMTAEEAIDAATDAALAQADASARAAFAEAETADERLQIEKALADARVAINIDAFNQIIQAQADTDQKRLEMEEKAYEDSAKKKVDAATKTASEISEAYGIASDALGDYFDSVLGEREDKIKELEDAIEEATDNGEKGRAASLERQLAAEKAAAEKAFKWQQALSASNATVNWLEAVVKATTYGPIGGPLVAGAATLAYGLSLKQIESEEPSFNDTPAGGYRFDGGSQSIRGAVNDTGILFRDPLEGVQQALDVMARRQAPTSTAGPAPRDLLGLNLARTPVGRLLTRDAERLTRGRLPGGRIGG